MRVCPGLIAQPTELPALLHLSPSLLSLFALSPSLRYVDASGEPTEAYPFNPNGSPMGIAGLCSANGRHLAMMPHPERCYLTWQLPYYPKDLGLDPYGPAPWIKLFQNAREWAESNAASENGAQEEF